MHLRHRPKRIRENQAANGVSIAICTMWIKLTTAITRWDIKFG
jgi:hypothetical protein